MALEAPLHPYRLTLQASGTPGAPLHLTLSLRAEGGHEASGRCVIDPSRPLLEDGTLWAHALRAFRQGAAPRRALDVLAHDLYRVLIEDAGLADAWRAARAEAAGRPLALTVALGPHSQALAALPLELLRDDEALVVPRAGGGLVRALLEVPPQAVSLPARPRVLFAWSCPRDQPRFAPEPHVEAMQARFGAALTVLPDATLADVQGALRAAARDREPFEIFHLLAHGFQDPFAGGGVALQGPGGMSDPVGADRLAAAVRDAGVQLAFLCSCQTAVAGAAVPLSGVAQQLLAADGGDLPCVIATQANLPVADALTLIRDFYADLADDRDPAVALARTRAAMHQAGGAWGAPVLLARPAPVASVAPQAGPRIGALPRQKATFQPREALQQAGLAALEQGRLVSVVGLPGVGKSEVGWAVARAALSTGLADVAVHVESTRGLGTAGLRARLAAALGLPEPPAQDAVLAAILASLPRRVLVVLDNAEELMRSPAAQDALRGQLDALLDAAPRLRVLLTTRWAVGNTRTPEREVPVPPMDRDLTERLLRAELTATGHLDPAWPASEAWQTLLDLIDGHPRSLILLARQLAMPGASLERTVRRLQRLQDDAVVEPDLLGRPEAAALGDDQRARLKSLKASMDLSFEVLAANHPEAVAAFAALSYFPEGLPEAVAWAVTGGDDNVALPQLLRMHLVDWQAGRVSSPLPLNWYAEDVRERHPVDAEAVHRRAIAAMAAFTAACEQQLVDGDGPGAISRLAPERATLRQLARWAGDHGEAVGGRSDAARMINGAQQILGYLSLHEERAALLDQAVAFARAAGDAVAEADALRGRSDLRMRLSELPQGEQDALVALAIYRAQRLSFGVAAALLALGQLQIRLEKLEEAGDALREALALFEALERPPEQAAVLRVLGHLAEHGFRHDEARAAYTAALEIHRTAGNRYGQADNLERLGDLYTDRGEVEAAQAAYSEALTLSRAVKSTGCEAMVRLGQGRLGLQVGALDEAWAALGDALSIFRGTRERLGEAHALRHQAEVQARRGDMADAQRLLTGALGLYRDIGDRPGEEDALRTLARLCRTYGDPAEVARIFGRALDDARSRGDRWGEAITLRIQGETLLDVGAIPEAEPALRAALALLRAQGDEAGEAEALHLLGLVLQERRALPEARAALTSALETFRRLGMRLGEGHALQALGRQAWHEGANAEADTHLRAALELYRALGDGPDEGLLLVQQAQISRFRGEQDRAHGAVQAAMAVFVRIGDPVGRAHALTLAGRLRMDEDDAAGAQAAWEEALRLYRRYGVPSGEGNVLDNLGRLYAWQGDLERAEATLAEALRMRQEANVRAGAVDSLIALAGTQAARGDRASAEEGFQTAIQLSEAMGYVTGAANARLQWGQLALSEGRPAQAHALLVRGLEGARQTGEGHGAHLAQLLLSQVASQAGHLAQALLIAETAIEDAGNMGLPRWQIEGLERQIEAFEQAGEWGPLAVTAMVLLGLAEPLGDAARVAHYTGVLRAMEAGNQPEVWATLRADPAGLRRQRINVARAALAEAGRGLLDPP